MVITETGVGKFTIQGGVFGKTAASAGTPALAKPAAAGLFINRGTGPTADDVLIRASRGELIVPARMVSGGAVDHLRGSIPGFAGGGLVKSGNLGVFSGSRARLLGQAVPVAVHFRDGIPDDRGDESRHYRGEGGRGAGGGGRVPREGRRRGRAVAGDVLRVLGMLGLPLGDAGTILAQMPTESGGNPNAINLTDSTPAAGDPSRGLMQTIGSTFAAYAGPVRGRSTFTTRWRTSTPR